MTPEGYPDERPTDLLSQVQEAYKLIQENRDWADASWVPYTLERAQDNLADAIAFLGGELPQPETQPETPAPSSDWGNILSGAQGIAGRNKWYVGPDANGIDIFVPRYTVFRAPKECQMYFSTVQGGPGMVGEMILVFRDGSAARARHVVPMQEPGYYAIGTPLAYVYDTNLDMLRWPQGYGTPPDGYQHLDLALASAPERLNPAGGAGGDWNAYHVLWELLGGIPNITIIPRTPGPVEGMQHLDASVQDQWHAWAGTKA